MKRYFYLLLAIGFVPMLSYADTIYPVLTIPASLRQNAHAVIRLHETTFEIKSPGEAVEKTHYVITILDEKGSDYAEVVVRYDKLSKFNSLQGVLYDEFGKQVSKLKKSDIEDISLGSAGQLVGDNRAKIGKFTRVQYPYTVEFEYEVTSYNMMFYPYWAPQDEENLSVEKATFQVQIPVGMEFRYKEWNLAKGVATSSLPNGNKQYTWEVENLMAFEEEPYSPPLLRQVPSVYTAPVSFEVEGYKGNFKSWEDLGKFYYTLNAGRDVLPAPMQAKVQQLVAGETDVTKKVKKVYEYLQTNTRYVGIQLGIGGWQTFTATEVADKGYGDCKALSNYTKAMLKSIGIESYYTLVRAGQGAPNIITDFPCSQFNHVLLCVPVPKDTLWLECTSQDNPFSYQGSFTGNRHALLVTPAGGKLVKTTQYQAKNNLQTRKAQVTLDKSGDAKSEITTIYTGEQQDEISGIMHDLNTEDQKKQLYKRMHIPSFEINQFSFSQQKDRIPSVTENLSLSIRKCAAQSGTRMFLTPNLMNVESRTFPKAENRKTDFVITTSYQDIDTVVYTLPKGYGIEFVPENSRIESQFGTYMTTLQSKEGEITYIRQIVINRGQYAAKAYTEWVEFMKKVAKADKIQAVLVNKGM